MRNYKVSYRLLPHYDHPLSRFVRARFVPGAAVAAVGGGERPDPGTKRPDRLATDRAGQAPDNEHSDQENAWCGAVV